MKAYTVDRYGAPEDVLVLADVDNPTVTDDEVLVEVGAAAVNAADWHLVRGMPRIARLSVGLRRPGFTIPGSDFAGRVVAVGPEVTSVAVGDEVFGTTFMRGFGAFAQRVVASETLVAHRPAGLSLEEAAGLPLAASTALQALRDHGNVVAGQRVLVIGASGGVGTFAVQIARALGAHVTGVCSTRNVDLVRSLGADDVIDYTTGAWPADARYDLVLQLAGTATARQLRRALTPAGTLLLLSGDSPNHLVGPMGRIIGGRLLSAFVSQTITTFTVKPTRTDLETIAKLADRGDVNVVIDASYPFEDAVRAITHVETGRARGKVTLSRP